MPRAMLTRYLVLLVLLTAFTTGGYFTVKHLISIQEENASLVTVSGNQLMLSQRIVTTAVSFLLAADEATRRQSAALLVDSVKTMANAHALLTGDSGQIADIFARSVTLKEIYYQPPYLLDQQVKRFLQAARELIDAHDATERQSSIETILGLSGGNLSDGLSAAVRQYQAEVRERIQTLESLRLFMLAAIYVLLALDGLLIFRPLAAHLSRGEQEMATLKKRMEEEASTDPLTRMLNRRTMNEVLAREHANVARYGGDLSLLLVDIDRFKDLNARYGQEIGDRLLQEVAQLVQNNVRRTDYVFRSGGGEFAVLAVSTQLEGALLLAEKIAGLARSNVFYDHIPLKVRIGVARLGQDESPDHFLARTTHALELARRTSSGVAEAEKPPPPHPAKSTRQG